jgi:hypothetical protein
MIIAIIAFFVFREITIITIIALFFREKRLSFGAIFSRKMKRNDYHYQPSPTPRTWRCTSSCPAPPCATPSPAAAPAQQ